VPDGPTDGRSVTLVVMDDDGTTGELGPLAVPTPWWPDVRPLGAAFPGLAVLRLLHASPPPGAVAGGDVVYLAEWLPEDLASTDRRVRPLRSWRGTLHPDALRLPWASPGGPAADLRWACGHLTASGPPEQHRTWNLSSIWTIPTTDGGVWLKCVPGFSEHESKVLELLDGHPVPRLLAVDGHRQLLEPMPGEDGYGATLAQHRVLIDELVAMQLATMDRLDELLAAGVPDRRWPTLLELATDVVARNLPEDPELQQLLETADERIAAIGSCGLPEVLVHGDAHGGNARIGPGTGRGIWFDWADARLGNPLLDVAVLERPRTPHRGELIAHWLDAWRSAVPGSDPHRAWPLVRPLAALGDAVVYQGFLDQIEASERIYHRDDVLPCLWRASEHARTGPAR
jgi:Phosphotransferase enzyme family